jgi:hypothetical protein
MNGIFSNGRYANVTATMALVVALGGSAYAANTIRSSDIKNGQVKQVDLANNAVTSAKVRNGALLSKDFKSGQIPAGQRGATGATGANGPKGDKGDKGDAGAPGSALAFGRVLANGTLDAGKTKNLAVDAHPLVGRYCLVVPATAASIVAQLDLSTGLGGEDAFATVDAATVDSYCGVGPSNALVTVASGGIGTNRDFMVVVN